MCYENFVVNQKASIFVSYVIKEFAHAFSCAYIELYGCTWDVWRALMKLELHSAIASCNSYASFVLSTRLRASITRYMHAKHEQILNLSLAKVVLSRYF